MPQITVTITDRIAEADTHSIVCGRDDYTLLIEHDAEWYSYSDKKIVVQSVYRDGTSETTSITDYGAAVALPQQDDAYAILISYEGKHSSEPVASTQIGIACTEAPEADETIAEPGLPYFDVYNTMMEYIAGALHGGATHEQMEAVYQALVDHYENPPTPEAFPSTEYRVAIAAPIRTVRLTGSITLTDSTVVSIDSRSIKEDSVRIHAECMADDYILPGAAVAKELRLSLLGQDDPDKIAGARIVLAYEIKLLSGEWYTVPLGRFTVATIESAGDGDALPIVAYDDMYRLGQIEIAWFNAARGSYYTPQQIFAICALQSGIPYTDDVSSYINGDKTFEVAALSADVVSLRDLVMHTAQAVCSFAEIDRNGKLRIRPISSSGSSVAAIGKGQRTSTAVERAQYELFSLTTTLSALIDGTEQMYTIIAETLRDKGVKAVMPENPLYSVLYATHDVERPEAVYLCIKAIVENGIENIVYNPLSVTIYGDPAIELFERRTVTAHGKTYTSPITSYDWAFNSHEDLTACGKDAVAGIEPTQLEKQQAAERATGASEFYNNRRSYIGMIIQSAGHSAMQTLSHFDLAKFTQGELSGTTPITYDGSGGHHVIKG